jgi:hypothetical protein
MNFSTQAGAPSGQQVIEERNVDKVAAELGVTAGSIYMSRSRIMARIRKKVGE